MKIGTVVSHAVRSEVNKASSFLHSPSDLDKIWYVRCIRVMPFITYEVPEKRQSEEPTLLGGLTLRRLMSYIYIYMEHPFLMFLDHTQRRSTVGRTPLDE